MAERLRRKIKDGDDSAASRSRSLHQSREPYRRLCRRTSAPSRLHAFPALVLRVFFLSSAADRLRYLHAMVVSLAHATIWRRRDGSYSASMVRARLRYFFWIPGAELGGCN